ncbi:hypothetical protein DW1_2636 [Proteiniborus sp. DW1]|uniref:copper amine oxidase N-terminal domain-containing protein n=1 Tax=Proteiniborus sp. DW1 TaxID=1889883 RepID=UPI00092DFF81|nr:copper amine oxidase N-terminal domain-containing protein [Proteiniborus sp. DW1]SCG84196.1 hypothetical protein DW1_2636 [Proteiniborus sp. DW1]
MKRPVKIVRALSLALVISSGITPIYATSIVEEPIAMEESSLLSEYKTISAIDSWEEKINYITFEGSIKEIKAQEGYLFVSLTDGNTDEIIGVFSLSEETMIVDQGTGETIKSSELKEGQKLTGYYRKDMPMIMIYPPRINPELVIIKDEEERAFIKHSNFNEELVSVDNFLKLNISEDTIITDQKGEECKEEELHNQDLVVFYTITTKSIPAQTNPSKIIVLKKEFAEDIVTTDEADEVTDESSLIDEIAEIIKSDSYKKDEVVMVPLRKIAEHLGYEVEWNNENRSVILRKGNVSFILTIGKEEYGYNKSLGRLEQAPELTSGKTYVTQSFIDVLSK